MSPSALDVGPVVSDTTVTFTFSDPAGLVTAVRLAQDVRIPGDRLNFTQTGNTWMLTVDRPDVWRLEYQFEVTGPAARSEHVCDPTNPLRVSGAFGDKSVLLLPGYRQPWWVGEKALQGQRRETTVAARALGTELPIQLWSPEGTAETAPLPMLLVHDGPEYDALGSLTTYLGVLIGRGRLPPLRAALLPPGTRDEWYSGSGAYAGSLALAVVPHLKAAVATTTVVGMGASLGALAMLHAQRRYPDLLGALFLQSGSFFHPRFDAHERRFSRYDRIVQSVDSVLRSTGQASPVPVVMTCGRIEENLDNNRMMARVLAAQGYDVALHELADMHNYTAWRDAFEPHLTRLLRLVAV